ncbi:MAG TPA: nitrous oxide reductase accessory protein NosL [Pyrinomonadaceae bacterium]|nr:nitrous oxide reductase accessory protein NosL [Pyrinomonadaceae bacterium]
METTTKRSLFQTVIAKLSIVFVVSCGLATLVVLANCQKKTVEPVTLEASDMCSFCRMSISEKRYAAEVIDNEGQAFKFDDIGCMTNYIKLKKNNASIAATFVMDFDRREWLKAENAFYVRSSEFKTPMNGGIVAFSDQSPAQAAAAKYNGTTLRFADVTK